MRLYYSQIKNHKNVASYFHYYDKPDCFYCLYLLSSDGKGFYTIKGEGRIDNGSREQFYDSWFLKWQGDKFVNEMKLNGLYSHVLCCSDVDASILKTSHRKELGFATMMAFKSVFENRRQFALFFHNDARSFHFHSLVHPVDWQLQKFDVDIEPDLEILREELRKRINAMFNIYSSELSKNEEQGVSYERKESSIQKPEELIKEDFSKACIRGTHGQKQPAFKDSAGSSFLSEIEKIAKIEISFRKQGK